MCCFFFFKQKTAYEMRISDWSSDVCSSDLDSRSTAHRDAGRPSKARPGVVTWVDDHAEQVGLRLIFGTNSAVRREGLGRRLQDWREAGLRKPGFLAGAEIVRGFDRSEEHTSELQSLMRISYAVFCLKKKQQKIHNT